MSKQLRLDVAQLTDVGRKRPHNEDNMAYVIPKDPQVMARKGALFIVADGMGGHAAGEVASEIAVYTVSSVYYQEDGEHVQTTLLSAIRQANALIYQRAAENMLRSGMGTTCVAAVLRGNMAYVANVGDSRAYLIRKGRVRQISQDHSWVEEQVRAGLLTRDQARSHAQRNVITRSLGTQADVEVDFFIEPLEEGDSLVLCSDGLSGYVSDEDLLQIVDTYEPQESVYHLVERANGNGGPDNITAIAMRVMEVGTEPPELPRSSTYALEDESTAILNPASYSGTLSGLHGRMDEARTSTATLKYSLPSSPLAYDTPMPHASATLSRPRSKPRLLYPTLAFLVMLVVVLGGAGYYFFWPRVDFESNFTTASSLIDQAQKDVTDARPSLALQNLQQAQGSLRLIKTISQSSDQEKRYNSLISTKFLVTVKDAITAYNKQGMITQLPCADPLSLVPDATDLQATSFVPFIGDGGKTNFTILGNDKSIYLVDGQTGKLSNKYGGYDNFQPQLLASGHPQHLVTLLSKSENGTTSYRLALLQLSGGNWKMVNDMPLDNWAKDGFVPSQLAVWQNDLYLTFTGNDEHQVQVLSISIKGDKFDDLNNISAPKTIMVTAKMKSLVAFSDKLLFFLDEKGRTFSLLDNVEGAPVAAGLSTSKANLLLPLKVSSDTFTFEQDVPTPEDQKMPFLLSDNQAFLAAGSGENNSKHLYLLDNQYARVLDFTVAVPSSQNDPISLDLQQQYASKAVLPTIASAAHDPQSANFYVLSHNGQNNLLTVDVSGKTPCSGKSS